MKRILFVEDSALLREVYRALAGKEGAGWDVVTASGGAEALETMKNQSFDVVASDMRLGGMNGIELLTEVTRLYPQTSRIIISGSADRAEAAEALGSTHQFLMKPVEYQTLAEALTSIGALDEFLRDEKLRVLVGRLRALPSFPTRYLEIMKAVEAPDTPLQVVYDLIVGDPGLTAKVLQVANSAAMGFREKIVDPLEAVQLLGLNTVRALALSAHVFASFTPAQRINFPMDALWDHLMRCGDRARAIMQVEGADTTSADAAYTAGILHDIGKLMLADSFPAEFQSALAQAASRDVPFQEIEMEVFGATHAGLAAYLLGLWGLPASIVEAVAFHHAPGKSSHQAFSPLTAVHAANALEHETEGDPLVLDKEYLRRIGVAGKVDAWR
ncbi:MAG TPA: response regulator [Verrucomicrobiae bacterium]|jgi:HD-like signal output (HDOD) protein|nr:response regulator [Verrucomicrobiae bacterium]